MRSRMIRSAGATLLAAMFLAALPAAAMEVAGIPFPDTENVGPGHPSLPLNGAGVRRRAFFQIYAIGLYMPKKTTIGAEAIAAPGPKRVAIHLLRDVTADQFAEAISGGMRTNSSEAQWKALEPRIAQLSAIIARMKEAKRGTRITLDDISGATHVSVDGKPIGAPIPGDDFYRALLGIWIGDRPVQDDLKRALLGGGP